MEDCGGEAHNVSLGTSFFGSASLKKFKLRGWPITVLSYSSGHQLLSYRSTVYVHTNMHAVSVCFCNPRNCDTIYRFFNVPT